MSVARDETSIFPGGEAYTGTVGVRESRKAAGQVLLVALLALGISGLHYLTAAGSIYLHVVYRELYFLPIILAGFWFGLRGGIVTACGASLLYFPSIAGGFADFRVHDLGNAFQIVLFLVIGLLTGWLRDRERRQQRLREQEAELSAMGAAAACVAHDLKAPLLAIGGFARLVRKKIVDDEASAAKLDIVIQQTVRLENMVADMLVFSRPLQLNRQKNSMNTLLSDTILLCSEKAESGAVELLLETSSDEIQWNFDFDRFQQALINLVHNAIEACDGAGTVILRGGYDAGSVVIEVEDSGAGIPPESSGSIFEPFVSGKKKGTGLGLPIVLKIVTAHGGALDCCPGHRSGTIFRVRLPLDEPGTK